MLPREHRLTRSPDFRRAVRRGRRVRADTVVLHALLPSGGETSAGPVRVGFVVSKAVGGATTRNRVKRRLRHIVASRIHRCTPGAIVVVRALPAAAAAPYARLVADVDRGLKVMVR
ncbi:MAG: ribonuclease P protein component [Nocardioidaceae bacterium]